MDSIEAQSSSQKDNKALRFLVTKFVEMYNRDDVDRIIGIDQAVARLGVQKRRIYDILNLFNSFGLVGKTGKGQFVWKGFEAIDPVLYELKVEAMKEKFAADVTKEIDEGTKKKLFIPDLNKPAMVIDEEDTEESFNITDHDDEENSEIPKPGNKMWKIARKIVKHFLCSDDDAITTIKDLTKALLIDESEDRPTKMKCNSYRRCIYDPIIVLSSINLIEKIYNPETKIAAAYRWIGPKPIADSASSKKRASGIGTSSLNSKRNKRNCSYLEADATNFSHGPSTSDAGSANECSEVTDAFRSSQKD